MTCIVPNCDRGGRMVRGLCLACYNAAARLMRENKATEDELILRGLLLPVQKPRVRSRLRLVWEEQRAQERIP